MEELIQVQTTKTIDVTPQGGVGESLVVASVTEVAPATDFTKVDNNLTGIGFFTASSKRSRKAIEKTTVVIDQGVEHRISILPSAKYGLPITQDQDYWLALMKLVSEHVQREGQLANPFSFTTAQLTKILGQVHSGKNYKAVEEWLAVMVSTTVEGGAYNTVQKTWYSEKTHAVDRVVSVGKKLPNGFTADKNYIWFSQWQLDNINSGNLISIDLPGYTQLKTNIARNLVPHLQEWLFASQRDGRFEKKYEDVCQLLGTRAYVYVSQIEQKFGPSLNELVEIGYISKWAIEPMATKNAYKVVLWHGPKYHSDRKARLNKNPHHKKLLAQQDADVVIEENRPRQKPIALLPEVDTHLLEALTSRGVLEKRARTILAKTPTEFPMLDTLEWIDQLIAAEPHKFTNPAGFYITMVNDQVTPPGTFESSRQRKAREEERSRADAEYAEKQHRQFEYEEYISNQVEQFARSLPDSEIRAITAERRKDLGSLAKTIERMTPQNQEALLWGLLKAAVRPRVQLISFQEFSKKRAEETNAQPSLFEHAPSPEQGTTLTLSSEQPLLVPKTRLETPEPPKLAPLGHPEKIAPLKADSDLTAQPTNSAEPEVGLHDRYEQWSQRKIQTFLDSLGMLERGRRRTAARGFLLTQHPEADRFNRMLDEENFEELSTETENYLFISIEKEMTLPDFEAWKAYQ